MSVPTNKLRKKHGKIIIELRRISDLTSSLIGDPVLVLPNPLFNSM
jgi:hypothetical protein